MFPAECPNKILSGSEDFHQHQLQLPKHKTKMKFNQASALIRSNFKIFQIRDLFIRTLSPTPLPASHLTHCTSSTHLINWDRNNRDSWQRFFWNPTPYPLPSSFLSSPPLPTCDWQIIYFHFLQTEQTIQIFTEIMSQINKYIKLFHK